MTAKNPTPKKELPYDHPLRMRFEAILRKKFPEQPLFFPVWGAKDAVGDPTGKLEGTYKNIEAQTLWEGFRLGYQAALDVATTSTYPPFDISDIEGWKG